MSNDCCVKLNQERDYSIIIVSSAMPTKMQMSLPFYSKNVREQEFEEKNLTKDIDTLVLLGATHQA